MSRSLAKKYAERTDSKKGANLPKNGTYSGADLAKKLSGATTHIAKNKLQNAVHLLYDALATLHKQNPRLATHHVAGETSKYQLAEPGAPLGAGGGEFRRATVTEEIALATLCLGREDDRGAVQHIRAALRFLKQLGERQNKELQMTPTPREREGDEA